MTAGRRCGCPTSICRSRTCFRETYVQSEPVRLELYARAARCRSEDDLDDLEEETSRRFGPLPPVARDFFAAARLRLDCKRRGIIRLDVGPGAVAATFLPGRLRKSRGRGRSLQRDGDRVVYHSQTAGCAVRPASRNCSIVLDDA